MEERARVFRIASEILRKQPWNWDNSEKCWCLEDEVVDDIIKMAEYITKNI